MGTDPVGLKRQQSTTTKTVMRFFLSKRCQRILGLVIRTPLKGNDHLQSQLIGQKTGDSSAEIGASVICEPSTSLTYTTTSGLNSTMKGVRGSKVGVSYACKHCDRKFSACASPELLPQPLKKEIAVFLIHYKCFLRRFAAAEEWDE